MNYVTEYPLVCLAAFAAIALVSAFVYDRVMLRRKNLEQADSTYRHMDSLQKSFNTIVNELKKLAADFKALESRIKALESKIVPAESKASKKPRGKS